MVIGEIYRKLIQSSLPTFIGLSLFNISIGLSVAIAKTDTLSVGYKTNSLTLAKKAVELKNEAEKIEKLATQISKKRIGKEAKDSANKIADEAIESTKELDEIINSKE